MIFSNECPEFFSPTFEFVQIDDLHFWWIFLLKSENIAIFRYDSLFFTENFIILPYSKSYFFLEMSGNRWAIAFFILFWISFFIDQIIWSTSVLILMIVKYFHKSFIHPNSKEFEIQLLKNNMRYIIVYLIYQFYLMKK